MENQRPSLRWLIAPENPGFLVPLTAFWILGLDWVSFSQEVFSLGFATPIVVVVGFLLGAAGTFFFQKRFAGDSFAKALLKAVIAGVVVGIPWPMTGTIVGGWILLLAGIRGSKKKQAP